MPYLKPKICYVHDKGITAACFDETGDRLLTCGSEGDVRIFQGFGDDDPVTHKVGKYVRAVLCKNDSFYTLTESQSVDVRTFPEGDPDGIVTRFPSAPTHMDFDQSGNKLAVGSEDFILKYVNVHSNQYQTFEGHEAPVLSVAVDPKSHYLASASCDGSVKIWKISDQRCVETLTRLVPKSNDFGHSKRLCRIAWDKEGKSLFVPTDDGVRVFQRMTWDEERVLFGRTNKEFNVVAVSPCGTYVAAGTMDGCVYVQCVAQSERASASGLEEHVCLRHDRPHAITCVVWHPNRLDIVYCDDRGQIGLFEGVKVDETNGLHQSRDGKLSAMMDSDDDDMMGACLPEDEGSAGHHHGNEGSDLSEDDEDAVPRLTRKLKALHEGGGVGMDNDDSNLDSLINELTDRATGNDDADMGRIHQGSKSAFGTYKPTPLQEAFQSSSTPVGLQSRFMVWNGVGVIKQLSSDDEDSVTVKFHDTSVHHTIHLTNTDGFTMAAMTQEVVVLASPGPSAEYGEDEDEEYSSSRKYSKLQVHQLTSWDPVKEWSITLPKQESVKCVCAGLGWVAAATSARFLRIFDVCGSQTGLLSVAGDPVTMAAHGNLLMVVYHSGVGNPGDQCLSFTLLKVEGSKGAIVVGPAPLPLSPRSTLSWIGFSGEGTPFSYDSVGRLRVLDSNFHRSWVPVADLNESAKNKSGHFWVVGISEKPAQIRCILCRSSPFPPTLPWPSLTILPFKMPFCDLKSERGSLEESLVRSQTISRGYSWETGDYPEETSSHREARGKDEKITLLKLFALACKSDRECRAVEICRRMPSQQAVRLAIKYATGDGRPELASRLNDVAREKALLEEEERMYGTASNGRYDTDDIATPVLRRVSSSAGPRSQSLLSSVDDSIFGSQDVQQTTPLMTSRTLSPTPPVTTPGPKISLKRAEAKPMKSLLGSQRGSANPFKKTPSLASPGDSTPTLKRGSSVFDDMSQSARSVSSTAKHSATTPATTPASGPGPKVSRKDPNKGHQTKLFAPKSASMRVDRKEEPSNNDNCSSLSAFDLWYESSRADMDESEDGGSPSLKENAMSVFSKLPVDEKKLWITKAQNKERPASTKAQSSSTKEQSSNTKKQSSSITESSDHLPTEPDVTASSSPAATTAKTGEATKAKLASFAFQS